MLDWARKTRFDRAAIEVVLEGKAHLDFRGGRAAFKAVAPDTYGVADEPR